MIVLCINTGLISIDCFAVRHDATRCTAGEHASLISHSVTRMSADFVRNREEHITNGVWYVPGSDDEDRAGAPDTSALVVSYYLALQETPASGSFSVWCNKWVD